LLLLAAGCPGETAPPEEMETDPATGSSTNPDPTLSSGSSGGMDTEGDESSESSDTTDAMQCGANQVCLGKPPLGWTGPIVVAKGQTAEDLPKCKGPYKTNDAVRFEGFHQPGAAECSCSCAMDPNQCDIYVDYYSGSNCNTYLGYDQPATGCYEFSETIESFYISSYYYGGMCAAEREEVIPELEWDAVVRGCGGAPVPSETCDLNGRRCYDVPADGYESQVCYIAEGDLPCPPGTDYAEKTIRYTAVSDSRDCSNCTCGFPAGGGGGFEQECISSYDFFTSDDCSGTASGTATNYNCNDAPGAQSVSIEFDAKSCPVQTEPQPEGEVVPEQPWTYCCAPF
jgi:hypothetical protein